VSSEAHKQADGQLKIHVKIKKITEKKPLLVPTVALSWPRAISYELTCSQSSSLIAQQSIEKKNINKEKTTAGTRQWL
jgi:hypothetical protein